MLIQLINWIVLKVDLDKKESPPVTFNHVNTADKLDSVVYRLVEKSIERQKVDDAFPLSSDNILIDPVTVTGYRLTPNRKKVMEKYGKPDEVINGESIQEKEEKWSYGLYSVLMFHFSDKVQIVRGGDGTLYASIFGSDMTLVVIDGIPVKYWEYPLIPNIPPSEVSSFEIIECAKNFGSLYCEAMDFAIPPDILCGSVIAIYTYGKKGIYGARQPAGLVHASVPVFSAPREFYAPKYDNIQNHDWHKPDLRALVHWEPVLQTDSLGIATTRFYNADNVGEMMVVVEATSGKGEIGYEELVYEIEGKEQDIIIVH
jgi:hypothetical protein